MDEPSEEQSFANSYLDFYSERYSQYLVEKKLVEGREMVGMFICKQPAGDFPDDPINEYNIQMALGAPVRARFDIGDSSFDTLMRKGDFLVVPPGTPSNYEIEAAHSVMGLGLPKSYFDAALRDANAGEFSVAPLLKSTVKDPVIARLMNDAWKEAATGGDMGALYVDTNILAIVSRIVALATKAGEEERVASKLSDNAFALIADYVESNVDTAIRMKTLANLAGLGEFEFARQFKERTGMPPYQWVIERRISKAEEMLKRTDLDIAEIAYAAGFSSQAHMTTLFRKKRSITPLEVRRELRG